jgi:hypothetical protein
MAFAEGYFFMTIIWGMIYFVGLALSAPLGGAPKFALIISVAGIAALATYLFYSAYGLNSFDDLVVVYWEDGSESLELPVTTGILLSGLVGFLYLFVAATSLFWERFVTPRSKG